MLGIAQQRNWCTLDLLRRQANSELSAALHLDLQGKLVGIAPQLSIYYLRIRSLPHIAHAPPKAGRALLLQAQHRDWCSMTCKGSCLGLPPC